MRTTIKLFVSAAMLWAGVALGAQPAQPQGNQAPSGKSTGSTGSKDDFKLHSASSAPSNSTSTTDRSKAGTPVQDESLQLNYDLAGPYEMRSADPEPTGQFELKNIFGWSTAKDGTDDDATYEIELEWGVAQNHELIFEVPMELGDGRIDGNADAAIGWHWRLWEEQDMLPAFAMRNYLRMPTGVDSSGVDWKWIGLITKSIVPGKLRFDFNPWFQTVNGDNEEDGRHFRWGAIAGVDWKAREDLVLIASYRYENGELEGTRDNHSLELGGEWEFAEHHELGFSTQIGLDGDGEGPTFGAMLSYIFEF